jgi:hypothetical protein
MTISYSMRREAKGAPVARRTTVLFSARLLFFFDEHSERHK